jgi:NTE family protein
VLDVLEREGIPVDMIAGTSMGAVVGAIYAQSKDIERMKKLAMEEGPSRLSWLVDPALPKSGLVRGRKIEEKLKAILGDTEFKDLKIPFACIATDIDRGEEVVIREGLVWKAVRASISIPVILAVVKREGRYLVDGALVNPVPVSVLKAMGAAFIIAVNVIPDESAREPTEPNIFIVVMQTFHIASCLLVKSSLNGADFVIEPQVEEIGLADFHRAEESILQGEMAARKSIAEIKRKIYRRAGAS